MEMMAGSRHQGTFFLSSNASKDSMEIYGWTCAKEPYWHQSDTDRHNSLSGLSVATFNNKNTQVLLFSPWFSPPSLLFYAFINPSQRLETGKEAKIPALTYAFISRLNCNVEYSDSPFSLNRQIRLSEIGTDFTLSYHNIFMSEMEQAATQWEGRPKWSLAAYTDIFMRGSCFTWKARIIFTEKKEKKKNPAQGSFCRASNDFTPELISTRDELI